jgi:hypothetical protein
MLTPADNADPPSSYTPFRPFVAWLLRWLALCWLTLCWLTLRWLTLRWLALRWLALRWLALRWLALCWLALRPSQAAAKERHRQFARGDESDHTAVVTAVVGASLCCWLMSFFQAIRVSVSTQYHETQSVLRVMAGVHKNE